MKLSALALLSAGVVAAGLGAHAGELRRDQPFTTSCTYTVEVTTKANQLVEVTSKQKLLVEPKSATATLWSKFRSDENFANKESLTLKKLSPTKLVASSKWKHTGILPDKNLAGLEELYSVDVQEQFTFNLKNRNVTAEVLESEVYLEGHYTEVSAERKEARVRAKPQPLKRPRGRLQVKSYNCKKAETRKS